MNVTSRIHLNPQSKGNLGKSFDNGSERLPLFHHLDLTLAAGEITLLLDSTNGQVSISTFGDNANAVVADSTASIPSPRQA